MGKQPVALEEYCAEYWKTWIDTLAAAIKLEQHCKWYSTPYNQPIQYFPIFLQCCPTLQKQIKFSEQHWSCIWTSLLYCPVLSLSQTSPCLQYKSFENTVGKGEIACNKQFFCFPQYFLAFWNTFCHFHEV